MSDNETYLIAIYSRTSTKQQEKKFVGRENESSVEVQNSACIEYVEKEFGAKGLRYKIVELYEDRGYSAKNFNRPAIQRLWNDIKNIDYIVTYDPTRIIRDKNEKGLWNLHLLKYGVKMKYAGANIDSDNLEGELIEGVYDVFGHYHRKSTSIKVRCSIFQNFKNYGKTSGLGEILGLDYAPNRPGYFVVNESEKPSVVRICKVFCESTSYADAIRTISRLGITDKEGADFTRSRFKNLMQNAEWRLRSKYKLVDKETGDEFISDLDYEPLISSELAKKVVEKRESLKKKNSRCGKGGKVYLCSQLLKTSKGATFQGMVAYGRSSSYRYYYCRDEKIRLSANVIEDVVQGHVIKLFKQSKRFKKIVDEFSRKCAPEIKKLKIEMKELKDKFKSLEDKVEALIEHLTRKDLSSLALESLTKKLNELESQKVNIQRILKVKQDLTVELSAEPDVEQIRKRIEKFANGIRDLDRSAKRALLEQIFEKIEVTKDNTLIVYYRAKHVKVSDNRGISENGLFNGKNGVADGTRTRDNQNHNLALYQLNYGHH